LAYLSIVDNAGRTVVLTKKPERIVPLSSSFTELLYAAGGKAAGKPSSKISNLPAAAKGLPEVGHVASINIEQLLSLRPDLVIGYQGMHEKFIPVLESSNIPFIIVKMKTYKDVVSALTLFGAIAGTAEQARKVAGDMEQRIQTVVDRFPGTAKKVVILHATARDVTVQLDGSIAGNVANILKLNNIAADNVPAGESADALPFSMEKLVERDPDCIFIAFTGDLANNGKRLHETVQMNPAWSELRAVRDKQVFFLPMELFLLNPGIRYDEAVLYLAKLAYPEIYGAVQ
jgi:iron complex transport system substrate-binding protein